MCTAGLPIDCTSRLLQYSGCRGPIFVPTPVLERLGQVADLSSMTKYYRLNTSLFFTFSVFGCVCLFLDPKIVLQTSLYWYLVVA